MFGGVQCLFIVCGKSLSIVAFAMVVHQAACQRDDASNSSAEARPKQWAFLLGVTSDNGLSETAKEPIDWWIDSCDWYIVRVKIGVCGAFRCLITEA